MAHCKDCIHYVVCWRVKEVETGNPMITDYVICRAYMEAPVNDDGQPKQGKWLQIPNRFIAVASKNGESYSGNATSCSICHEVNPNAYKTPYCPMCGSKMNLEE